ncbi:hypothetical protein [Algiphilus aromaticivorans]|uniref:hypothetical protein n=1 Tax=Algiphilus aromaticivorans TaxID=382454 RepID=UPI0005C1E094|nr:hypothetical protein [Algiphilus aromaticivorans]
MKIKKIALVGMSALVPILAGCGSDGSSGSGISTDPQLPATEMFAAVKCDLSGPVEGALDPLQTALVDNLGGALGDIPGLGASAESVVGAVATLLDVVDSLVRSAEALEAEGDPEAGQLRLEGAAEALQCGAKALYEAYALSPIATLAPKEVESLVAELVGLLAVLDGSLDPSAGLERVTGRLAGVADALSDLANVLPQDLAVLDGVITLSALTKAPAHLLGNLGDVLRSTGQLDGQATSDAVATTLTDLLGVLQLVKLPEGGEGALVQLLTSVQDALSNTLNALLAPVFDLLRGIFRNDEAGFASRVYSDFLYQGITATPGNALADYAGGMAPDGVDRPSLRSMIAE